LEEHEAGLFADAVGSACSPESLFHEQYSRLVRSLAIACGDTEAAADAVQEAFVQLCLHWKRVSTYENPTAWVRRVAVNRLSNHRRSLRRGAAALTRLVALTAPDAGDAGPSPDLRQALATLSDRQRTAVALFYVENLSIAEIAEAMGLSQGSVNTHLHRARATLRRTLEAQSWTTSDS
jgi:RNA polymerase sigma-70 factor, ECF subfamily